MDAPTFPPASTFVQPGRLPRQVNTRDIAINDLKAFPAAWAIVLKEIPNLEARIRSEALKPHLSNFSLRSIIQYGIVSRDALDRIDEQLHVLGEMK